jgi:hypothetical protein
MNTKMQIIFQFFCFVLYKSEKTFLPTSFKPSIIIDQF